MIIGATVLAGLVLLLLLAERGSSMLWQSGAASAFFYCRPCDLRYPREELQDNATGICPRGHIVQPVQRDFPWSNLFIFCCCTFIVSALLLIATGTMPVR